jgi:hypothetical protein
VTPTRLHESDFVFRFYVYGGTFDNPPGYFLSARATVFGALCAYGFLDLLGLLVCFLARFSDFVGGYHLVVYREASSRLQELLLGQGPVFSIWFFSRLI